MDPSPETERAHLALLNRKDPTLVPAPPPPRIVPPTEYARTADGVQLACKVLGDPRGCDIVMMPGFVTNVEVWWEESATAAFFAALATHTRLVVFDKRGTGMSDPAPEPPTLEQRLIDLDAVLDHIGSPNAIVFGVSEGGMVAVPYALRRPERVVGLVLCSTMARLVGDPPQAAWSPEFLDMFLAGIDGAWATGFGIDMILPTTAREPGFRDWAARYMRLSASPAVARQQILACATLDIADDLERVSVPTVVIHQSNENWVPVACGRYLAERIPRARLVETPGDDHWPWLRHRRELVDAVVRLLNEVA